MTNADFMKRAVALSKRGYPAPNPHVGCVLAKDGRIIGQGFHHHAGGPHAEIVALEQAGEQARGSLAFVTLEPCNGTGRTGPCSQALILAGVKAVTYAIPDPNEKMAGGAETLKGAGIDVSLGLGASDAYFANQAWLDAQRLQRPFVVVKAAMSLDGRIALDSGESKWITGNAARRAGHRLRAECGCVIVGRKTVSMDDPELTARISGVVNQPLRVVIDPDGKLNGSERVFNISASSLRFTAKPAMPIDVSPESFEVQAMLQALWKRGVTSVLVEGGATTIGHFFSAQLVDRLELFVAATALGNGPSWLDLKVSELAAAPRLSFTRVRRIGEDLQITAIPDFETREG